MGSDDVKVSYDILIEHNLILTHSTMSISNVCTLLLLTYIILQVQVGTSCHQLLNSVSVTLPGSLHQCRPSTLCDDRHVYHDTLILTAH